ncbi:MAG: alpha/beta hydrolase [Alphaproteobacteria bacterium]|nr:alpha/beta hydrolase [Alphaproteobacteria bacterium]
MVLIHDGALHSATWDDVWPIFCKDFHVVRYDRRGFGRSPTSTMPYFPVDDVSAVMHAAGVQHAIIVGSSAGGGLAVDFTLKHPEAVDRLILSGPQVLGLGQSRYFVDRTIAMQKRELNGDVENAIRDDGRAFAPGHEAALKRMVALLTAYPQDLHHSDDMARPAPPAVPLLSSIKAPTMILVGTHDTPDVQAWAGAIDAAIPGSHRVVVPDTGHLMYLEQPQHFVQLIEQFVAARQHPDRETALRRYLGSLERGQPNYEDMTPNAAASVRREMPVILALLKPMGAIKSIRFAYGTETGADAYWVTYAHGRAEWTVAPLTAEGKMQSPGLRFP